MQYATEENLTDLAVNQWEQCHTPHMRTIMQSLVKHFHSFVREVELTREEWLFAADWLAKTGQVSNKKAAVSAFGILIGKRNRHGCAAG